MNTMPAVGVILWRSMWRWVGDPPKPAPRCIALKNPNRYPASFDYYCRLDRINRGEKP